MPPEYGYFMKMLYFCLPYRNAYSYLFLTYAIKIDEKTGHVDGYGCCQYNGSSTGTEHLLRPWNGFPFQQDEVL
jgi:hypothetical protein